MERPNSSPLEDRSRLFTSLTLLVLLVLSSLSFLAATLPANASTTTPESAGATPSYVTLNATAYSFLPMIQQYPEFAQLSHGLTFHLQYNSIGYTSSPGGDSLRVVLFSANGSVQIVTDIFTSNNTIQDMYGGNVGAGIFLPPVVTETSITPSGVTPLINGKLTANYGGYYVQYCDENILGHCSYEGIDQVNATTIGPNTIEAPPSGQEVGACCKIAEWTGVANGSGGTTYLVQGGLAWWGIHLSPPEGYSPVNGFLLFTETFPNMSCTSSKCIPSYYSPPSWMNGIEGTTIQMSTVVNADCGSGGGGESWEEVWSVGSTFTANYIACMTAKSETYAWYTIESPLDSQCTGSNGGYYAGGVYFCQLPQFYSGGGALSWAGTICNINQGCRRLDSNDNTLQAYYIEHNSVDTTTGTIANNGNSWTEAWDSSN